MLNHKEICNMIPHSGAMCLLDAIQSWDENNIVCISSSHRNMSNPLRNDQGLSMLSLIEYGAQAMAVHGCLLAEKHGVVMENGYLAGLRDIQLSPGLLSDIEEDLEIFAERLYADAGNMIYDMTVRTGNKTLATGRATVVAKFHDVVVTT